MIRTITATQYVTPLREGGSLPAIVEGDDDGTYVLKFRGAGQGPKALIAELVSGEIARLLGLPVPEIVFAELDPRMAKTEPDPEIQDLLQRSAGLNLALDYLPGSITFDPLADRQLGRHMAGAGALASRIVWFDALVTNVDRTARNTNLLVWHRAVWMIDHGASLYFHHNWDEDVLARSRGAFSQIKDHVLLPHAGELREVDAELSAMLTDDALETIVSLIPDAWLERAEQRASYRAWLLRRLEEPREWVEEAIRARTLLV
ncbi:MAG: aminotransferase class I and II [Acidobacteriota bacterium]|nr:aminotransferase class I and II [Acidobacteriota bacterium]